MTPDKEIDCAVKALNSNMDEYVVKSSILFVVRNGIIPLWEDYMKLHLDINQNFHCHKLQLFP